VVTHRNASKFHKIYIGEIRLQRVALACPVGAYIKDNLAADRMGVKADRKREIVGFCLLKKK
jgi:hypothetical protein